MNCDAIARCYWLLEYPVFGRALERRRREFLEEVSSARRVLILGDGDGRFTAEFAKRNPLASVDSIELSRHMSMLARKRTRELDAPHLHFQVGDARTIGLSGKYDLIVTHFFLDCFTPLELRGLVTRIATHCCPEAKWVLSEFCLPRAGLRRLAARLLIWVMYSFFRLATGLKVSRLPDFAGVLANSGFQLLQRRTTAGGLLASELWSLRPQRHHRIDS